MVQNPKVPGTGNILTQLPLIKEEINLKRSLFPRVTSQKEAAPEQREIDLLIPTAQIVRLQNVPQKDVYNIHSSIQ